MSQIHFYGWCTFWDEIIVQFRPFWVRGQDVKFEVWLGVRIIFYAQNMLEFDIIAGNEIAGPDFIQ